MLETGVSESGQPHERDPIKLNVFGNNQSALYQAVTTADVNTQPANGGESGPVYSKRDLYERGHVAVCSHRQATCITVFVFTSIFLSSLVIAFARPWNDCAATDIIDAVDDHTEAAKILTATNGELFPWDDVRLPIFI